MNGTIVDNMYSDSVDVLAFLDSKEEFERKRVAEDHFRKSLLMAAASHFERKLTECVIAFAEEVGGAGHVLVELVRRKAVERQYHKWFNWDGRNANAFFSMFGNDFRAWARNEVEADGELDGSIRDFLQIGAERNRLVHQDYGNFSMEKTAEEVYVLYQSASVFVNWVPEALRGFKV